MRSPIVRTALALLLFSSWLALLFSGLVFGGAVHLLLVVALGLFPWRAMRGKYYQRYQEARPRT